MLRQNGLDDLIGRVERDGSHRVLRRISVDEGATGVTYDVDRTSIAIVVDVETTGTDVVADDIIELAVRRFRYDDQGRIVKIDRAWSWREDPGRPLEDEIVRLTGITDADLFGCRIDDDAAIELPRSADVVIAHNAGFDRKFVERRLPAAAGLAWCCSCREVDWAASGYEGRALGWLCAQAGWFFDGHRAESDIDAVVALLGVGMHDGRTALRELLDTAGEPSTLVSAVGASFDVKDRLRARGYRWNASHRVWAREAFAADLMREQFWLAEHVYAPEWRPRAFEPHLEERTWRERHA